MHSLALQDVSSLKDFFETNLDLADPDALMGMVRQAVMVPLAHATCYVPLAACNFCGCTRQAVGMARRTRTLMGMVRPAGHATCCLQFC